MITKGYWINTVYYYFCFLSVDDSIDYKTFWQSEQNNEFASDCYSGESCGSMIPEGDLNDIDCSFKMPFICHKTLKIL